MRISQYLQEKGVLFFCYLRENGSFQKSQTYGKGLNFGAFRKACLSKFNESEDSRPHLDHLLVFFPKCCRWGRGKAKKRSARENKSRSKRGKNGHLRVSVVSLLCVINSKKFSEMKAKVCSQTSCPVPSHCFTDCTCARESAFFV